MVDVTTTNSLMKDIVLDKAIIGNKVFTKNGGEIGVVKELYINRNTLSIEGITVYKSPFKYDHYIGKEYIENFGTDGIILNIVPLEEMMGKKVIDSSGYEVGKVKGYQKVETTNDLILLNVTPGFTRRDYIVQSHEIKRIGESVLLNKTVNELQKNKKQD
jgi:sporulation protein YlmC with PRC-barrel domain